MNFLRAVTAASLSMLSTAAYAFDTSATDEGSRNALFRNTKENVSVVVTPEMAQLGHARFARFPAETIDAVTEAWFASLSELGGNCEPMALTNLAELLAKAALPHRVGDVAKFLSFLRSEDRIDDVILFPIQRAVSSWQTLGFSAPPSLPERANGNANHSASVGRGIDAYFKGLSGRCPTQDYFQYIARKRRAEKNFDREEILADLTQARAAGLLSPYLSAWFLALQRGDYDSSPYPLAKVLPIYKSTKDQLTAPRPANSPPEIRSPYLTQLMKGKKYTRRMHLYAKYETYFQLEDLALIQRRGSRRMFATPKITWAEDTVLLPHMRKERNRDLDATIGGTDIYEVAAGYMVEELHELEKRPKFLTEEGLPKFTLDFEDTIVAAVETGIARGNDIETALRIPELRNPKLSTGEKIKKWATRLLGPAFILIPAPYNMVAAIGMALAQSFLLKSSEHRLPIFPGSDL